jgi:predicted permease
MNSNHGIRWGLILLAGFLAEVGMFVIFFLLLAAAALAGVPEVALPMTTLDYIDAMVSGFVMMFLFTLWVGRRIESGFVVHGILIGVAGIIFFLSVIFVLTESLEQPPLYIVAHALKVAGGIAGGLVAQKRSVTRRTLAPT